MAERYKAGDVVKLKSGGPLMTVKRQVSADHGGEYLCLWFTSGGVDKEGVYLSDCLMAAESPGASLAEAIAKARKRVE